MNTVSPFLSFSIRSASTSWAFCLTAQKDCQRDSTDLQTLSRLKTIHAIMCTFVFSQLLQEQRQRQLECKHRDGFLIIFAKTKRCLSLLLQLWGIPAKSSSMHTSPRTHPSLQTLTASQLFCLKLKNTPSLNLAAPFPSLNEHSRLLDGILLWLY